MNHLVRATRRRGRPSGARLLSGALIVDTALKLLDERGPGRLSMRQLADALGVHNNALYSYIAGRRELESAIVERLLTDADPSLLTGPGDSWRQRLTDYAMSLRTVLRHHPGAMPFFMAEPLTGKVALDVGEAMLRCFIDAGLMAAEASRASYIASIYLLGYLAFDIAETKAIPPLPGDEERAHDRRALLENVDSERYPLTAATADAAAHWVSKATFEWGLERMLDGLVQPGRS